MVGLPLSLAEKGCGVGYREKRGPSLPQGRKRDHSFAKSEEEGAHTPLPFSVKESRLSFSEREGGMPITLSQKERHHSFSEREREGQPNLLSERGDGEEGAPHFYKEGKESPRPFPEIEPSLLL